MTPGEARALIARMTAAWVDDDTSAVWSGEHDGRLGVRLEQQARDATTIWFDVGERTLLAEAYLLPSPRHAPAEVYRLALRRNQRSWPAYIAMDADGDLYVRSRLTLDALTPRAIDEAVAAIYEVVELSFRPMVRAGFASREKLR